MPWGSQSNKRRPAVLGLSALVIAAALFSFSTVAYYPKRGWVGVFKFPAQGGFSAYP